MANLPQQDHHWREHHSSQVHAEIVQQNHFSLRWAPCEGVLSDKSCVCPFRTPSQLEAEEEEEWCDRQLVGGVRPFLKSGNITSGLRKKCTGFYL